MAAVIKGEELTIGAHVRYNGTGSAGEVVNIRSDDQGIWAQVDTTKLWYNTSYLELLNKDEYLKLQSRKAKRKAKKSSEDVDEKEITKKKVEQIKQDFEDVNMSSELCDGGG